MKKLLERRGEINKRCRDLVDAAEKENRDFTAEEDAEFKKLHEEDVTLKRRADRLQEQEAREKELAEIETRGIDRQKAPASGVGDPPGTRDGSPTEEDRALALQAWCRAQYGMPLRRSHREACQRVGFNARSKSLRFNLSSSHEFRGVQQHWRQAHHTLAHQRALSGVTASAGGTTVPRGFINQLEAAMLQFGGVSQVAEIMRTQSGEDLPWPTANDTGNRGRRLGENQPVATNVDPTFGAVVWHAYNYTSDAILVPTTLFEDSAFDLASILSAMLGERLGRAQNYDNTLGTGAAQPRGIVTAAPVGKTTASATAITPDEIMEFQHSVDPAYRSGAGWMMHDNIVLAIRKFKDSTNQYLWQPGLQAGVPDRLLNAPVTLNSDMPSAIAALNKTMLYGQLNKYKVREVRGIRLYRLEERYRENDQDGFVAFFRQDGNLLDAGTGPVKAMQQHS